MNQTRSTSRRGSWWAKLVALVAIVNLVLVIFDLSYVPWRDLYYRQFPELVALYDPFKGIEQNRVTQKYLNTVDELTQQLSEAAPKTPKVESLLADLRSQSVAMIDENPFLVASKAGTFAKIKNRMRQEIGTESAKEAFDRFWNSNYLTAAGQENVLAFFDRQIRPSMEINYFRNIDDTGHFVDNFWKLDVWFVGFFAIDLFIGTLLASWRQPGISWFDAIWQRWYDFSLLLPVWQWLRSIPVIIRLHQAGLVNLLGILDNITYEPVAYLADRVSKFVMVRVVDDTQNAIKQGKFSRLFLQPKTYITINDVTEHEVIIDRLAQLIVYKILPQVQPQLELLLVRSLEATLKKSNLYQGLQKIPVVGSLPVEVTEQITNNLMQTIASVLAASYNDREVREVFDRLKQDFNTALVKEVQDEEITSELQSLLSDWLEEIKINYIHRSGAIDPKVTLAEVEKLDRMNSN
jgi:hypothetical protein